MCTVTWLEREAGYALWFNRDESVARGPEQAPRRTLRDGTAVVAPVDGEAGGTWIAANEHGLTVALLNEYVGGAGAPGARSRGLLVLDLAPAATVDELLSRVREQALDDYGPFVLVALAPGSHATTVRWDGTASAVAPAEVPLVSSSIDAARVRRFRLALYERVVAAHGGPSDAAIEAFLRSHDGGPGPATPCMHRADAATRSQCRVRVGRERVELVHLPGPPCTTAPSPAEVLRRRPSGER